MLKLKVTGLLVSCCLMTACGSSDSKELSDIDPILGTWISTCITDNSYPDDIEYGIQTTIFTGSIIAINYTTYETDNCINQVDSLDIQGTYTLGDYRALESGLEVRNIDLSLDGFYGDGPYTILQIIRIEQAYLYMGIDKFDESRPTEIDFTYWSEKAL